MKIVGMMESFFWAMRNACRFHTRGMMSEIVSVAGKFGWKSSLRLDDRVMIELMFGKKKLEGVELLGYESAGRSCVF